MTPEAVWPTAWRSSSSLPSVISWRAAGSGDRPRRALEASTQVWANVPGLTGQYSTPRVSVPHAASLCAVTATIEYGTLFSSVRGLDW